MSKLSRNDKCHCGSGKKFKACHGSKARKAVPKEAAVDPANLVGVAVDHHARQIIKVSADILVNQLRRDCPRIADSFDALEDGDLAEISDLLSRACFLLLIGQRRTAQDGDALRNTLAVVSFNAVNTLIGAVALLRQGFHLQAPILVRSILEAVANVLHLLMKAEDLESFHNGTLPLKRVLASAKDVLPPFGSMYGFFSQRFVHISSMHGQHQPLSSYTERSDALVANLQFIRFATWLIYVSTELLFLDVAGTDAKYWRAIQPGQAAYDPSEDTRNWQQAFLMGSNRRGPMGTGTAGDSSTS